MKLHVSVSLAVLTAGLGLALLNPGALDGLRLKTFDALQAMKPRARQHSPVAVIDIDDESLSRIGQWPWPRTIMARLLRRIQASGAAVVAFDIIFAEPDRTSPGRVVRLWPATAETEAVRRAALGGRLPDHDEMFAAAMAEGKVVLGLALSDSSEHRPRKSPGIAHLGDDPLRFVRRFSGATPNLALFEEAAAGLGTLNVNPDRDSVLRRVPLLQGGAGSVYPSLPVEALRLALGENSLIVEASGALGGITHLRIGPYRVPTNGRGQMWLYDPEPGADRAIPAWRVLADASAPLALDGKIVLVGSSATGLNDFHITPLDGRALGVAIHARAIEQMIDASYIHRPRWAEGAEVLYILVVGLALALLLARLRAYASIPFAVVAVALPVGLSWLAFARSGVLLAPVYPAAVLMAVSLCSAAVRYFEAESERRRVRGAFGRYLSPTLVDRLAANPSQLVLGGEMRDLSVMFCDIRGFTSISERIGAEELTRLINRFLTPMTEAVMESGGTVDKFIGDCVMALWNAPIDDEGHARHACAAALEMRRRLAALNVELESHPPPELAAHLPIRIGIGINSGECCVGNMGSEQRFSYSAMGDNVNLASRFERQTRIYGVDIIVGETTRDAAGIADALELDVVRVRGREAPSRIYTILDDGSASSAADRGMLIDAHDGLLAGLRDRQWAEARRWLASCRKFSGAFGLDDLYRRYDGRIGDFESRPPPPDWDGTILGDGG